MRLFRVLVTSCLTFVLVISPLFCGVFKGYDAKSGLEVLLIPSSQDKLVGPFLRRTDISLSVRFLVPFWN